MNYYEVLGVNRHASQHQIKRAYRQMAMKYHPDRNPNNQVQATQMFRQIQEAYEHLGNEKKRKIYDLNYMSAGHSKKEKDQSDYFHEQSVEVEVNFSGYTEQSKFESKDAILAIALIFMGHFRLEPLMSASVANKTWIFIALALAVGGGLLARALTKLAYSKAKIKADDGFLELIIYNAAAVLWLSVCGKYLDSFLDVNLIVTPMAPSLFVGLIAGLVGAAFGRAFAASGSAIVGMIGGAVVGGVSSLFFGVWVVFLHIAVTTNQNEVGMSSRQSFLALVIGSAIASALGSLTNRDIFIYNLLDWIEELFDQFRPRAKSSSLQTFGGNNDLRK